MKSLIILLCLYLWQISSAGPFSHYMQMDNRCRRIIMGQDTMIKMFPFQVSIRSSKTNDNFCGGAIITQRFVLTAGHCVCYTQNPISEYYIFVGSSTLTGQGHTYDIEGGYCHENYNNVTKLNDISIISIGRHFTFNCFVKPAKIVLGDLPVGTRVTISGWGFTSLRPKIRANTLQVTSAPIISMKECRHIFEKKKAVVGPSHICTLENGKLTGTCKGDSGGPLSYKGMLVGLVSWGMPCAIGKPDANTKVDGYVDWIAKKIVNFCEKRACTPLEAYPSFYKVL